MKMIQILRRIKNIEVDLEAVQKKQKVEHDGLRKELRNFITEQNERMDQWESTIGKISNYTSESVEEV